MRINIPKLSYPALQFYTVRLIMRSALFLLFAFAAAFQALAQCPSIQLSDLQTLRRANDQDRDSRLRGGGFDLRYRKGAVLHYQKCWNRNRYGKDIYDQVVWWDTGSGNITFLTPNEEEFLALRRSIENRHGQTGSLGSSDDFIGQQFKYHFGSQWLDGVMHWSVSIDFK